MSLKIALTEIKNHLSDWEKIGLNEAQTRQVIILRLLEQLGYNIWQPLEIFAEKSTSSSNYRPDFYIAGQAGEGFVIEAKSLGKPLTDADCEQAINYVNAEGLRWAILTNGKDWQFFDNMKFKVAASQRLAFSFRLQDSDAIEYFEKLLSAKIWHQSRAAELVEENIQVIQLYKKLSEEIPKSYSPVPAGLHKAIAKELNVTEQQFALQHLSQLAEMLNIDINAETQQKLATFAIPTSQPIESDILQRLIAKIETIVNTTERRTLDEFTVKFGNQLIMLRHWRDLHTALAELLIDLGKESELKLIADHERNLEGYQPTAYCLLSNGQYLLTNLSTEAHLKYLDNLLKKLAMPKQQVEICYKQQIYRLPE